MDQNAKDILAAVNFVKDKVEQLPTRDDVRAIIEEVVSAGTRHLMGLWAEQLRADVALTSPQAARASQRARACQ
jgi:hypothetical protein